MAIAGLEEERKEPQSQAIGWMCLVGLGPGWASVQGSFVYGPSASGWAFVYYQDLIQVQG